MIVDKTLLTFTCHRCAFQENIGVGFNCGLVFVGSLTIICPKCGVIGVEKSMSIVAQVTPIQDPEGKTA